jgi:cytochrome oxidase assembly protein ShyY1
VKRFFSFSEILKSSVALVLIALCLLASQWQWNKGQTQTSQNSIIKANIVKSPLGSLARVAVPINYQWQRVSLAGHFITDKQILVRNRYYQGQYGFEVLHLFQSAQGKIWINRGWVKAGATAETPPQIPAISTIDTRILTRIRSEDLSRQLQGSFFALPHKSQSVFTSAQQFSESDFNFYLDLLQSDTPQNKPLSPIDLPDLSNGPHYAYAIQWLAFALLTLIGRGLLFRETQRLPLV